MQKSTLTRKTALQAHTTLKTRTSLKTKTPLKAKTGISSSATLKASSPLKSKQKTAKKLSGDYWSIFTKDMRTCFITGDTQRVHPHHIFSGGRKALSEKYGFMLPLRADWHEGTSYSIHQDRNLELKYKTLCENYWVSTLHRSKEEWIEEFGMWWEQPAA